VLTVVYRIRFKKGEDVKFISHLDLMRCMTRSFKRAGINLSHTEGFNPHPKLSFGLPLPVGVSSDSCYMDVMIEDNMNTEDLICKLNHSLPKGLNILQVVTPEDESSVMSLVAAANYKLVLKPINCSSEVFTDDLQKILDQDGVYIEKETKKNTKMVNIKDLIHTFSVSCNTDSVLIEVMCDAGSQNNLNPMLILKAIGQYSDYRFDLVSVERTGLYMEKNKNFVPII